MPAGYSGTPLAKKLGLKGRSWGLKEGAALWARGMPASVKAEFDRQVRPRYLARPTKALAAAHIFHTRAPLSWRRNLKACAPSSRPTA